EVPRCITRGNFRMTIMIYATAVGLVVMSAAIASAQDGPKDGKGMQPSELRTMVDTRGLEMVCTKKSAKKKSGKKKAAKHRTMRGSNNKRAIFHGGSPRK